jgi:hypothetical protein
MLGGVAGALIRVLVGVAAIAIGIALGKTLIVIVGVALVAIFGVRAMTARNGAGSGKKNW